MSHSGSILAGYSAGSTGRYSAGYSAGLTGKLLWDTQRDTLLWWDTGRDPLASYSAMYSAKSTGELLCGILGGIHWQATRRDPLASYSGGYSAAGPTRELLWDTQRNTRPHPLASSSGYLAGFTGQPLWRDPQAGSTGEQLWRDTRRDPLASCSSGIPGGGVV